MAGGGRKRTEDTKGLAGAMTRFTDLLGRAGRRDSEPMGFGRAARRTDKVPDILMVGRIVPEDLSMLDASGAPVDALLLEVVDLSEDLLQSASTALSGLPWGVRTGALPGGKVEQLKAAGADFVVFDAAGTPGSVLTDEDLGKFLTVAADIDDETSRAVQTLPIDGVAIAIDADTIPLSIESILRLHRAITSGAHAIVLGDFDPGILSSGDLEAMRGSGVSALALPTTDAEGLKQLSDAIRELPEPRLAHDDRIALIPQVGPASDADDYDLHSNDGLSRSVPHASTLVPGADPESLDRD